MTSYSDLHCHPALYGFNRLRNTPDEHDLRTFQPWHVPDDVNHEAMARGTRASEYTQCTMPMLVESGTRLVYASITPIEKGFFVGSTEGDETNFALEVLKLVSGSTFLSSASLMLQGKKLEAGARAAGVLRNRGPARRLLQRIFLSYRPERVNFMQSDEFDYWDEFLREYAYYCNADGIESTGSYVRSDGKRQPVTGRYHLVRDAAHLDEVLEADRDVAVLLTIEGAHTFSIGPDQRRVAEDVLLERIEHLRNLPHAISFITLAHHFDNGLCGHAHSLPDAAHWVMDQRYRMGDDLLPIGRTVVRELLDLDGWLRPRGGQRILLDCKHMSPATRRTYYADFVRPYNAWARAEGLPQIPVVMSHTAYSGVATLDELVANYACEDDNWHRPPFLAWGINHCDEDVQMVFESGGLIGLVFDQRVCGVPPRQRVPAAHWIDIFLRQLFATVDVIFQDERIPYEERLTVWDRISLGTDFDGLIDPLTTYPTVLQFDEFRAALERGLDRYSHTRGIASFGAEELADKILWQNGVDFARRTLGSVTGQ